MTARIEETQTDVFGQPVTIEHKRNGDGIRCPHTVAFARVMLSVMLSVLERSI